jgi:regulatory protein
LEARQAAERFIDYQARSSAEVRRRLGRAGFDEDVVERVVSELESAGLLDDAQFSAAWVESRARSKKIGPSRLAAELRQRGISKEDTESALEQLDPDSALQNALALARKKLGVEEIGGRGEAASPERPTALPAERPVSSDRSDSPRTIHPSPEEKRRLAAFLQRRGYNWDIIQQVFAELFQNTD